MPTPQQQRAFGDALRQLMKSHDHSQKAFGEMIAEGTRGVDKPYSQSTVRDWIEKSAPDPEIVFYMEGYLLVPPGTLSQHLGYLPVGVRSVTTFQQALMNDTFMSASGRDMLLILYTLFASQPLVDATLTPWTRMDLERLVKDAKRTSRLLDQQHRNYAERQQGLRVAAEVEEHDAWLQAAESGPTESEGESFDTMPPGETPEEPSGP